MKKLLILICLLTCSATIFGQNIFTYTVRARGGIIIGLNGIKIDSVTTSNDTLSFWHGATELHQKGVGTYPSAGIPLSTGSAWGTSITNNSVNWDTAYAARMRWSGTPIGLTAATGRTSLGGTTVGQAFFTLTNPTAITFPRINADNSVDALSAANFKTALSLTSSDVGLGNVTNKLQIEAEDSVNYPLGYMSRFDGVTGLASKADTSLSNLGDDGINVISGVVHDTIQTERDNAVLGIAYEDYEGGSTGNDYYMTTEQVKSYVETYGGGELTGSILSFIVGTTAGAPSVGDSIIVHSTFENSHIDLYRNGYLSYFHTGAVNPVDSTFRLKDDTITVRPNWTNNERVEFRMSNAIAWTNVSLEGEEDDLLTGLQAYYKMNEPTIGAALVDETGTLNSNTVYKDSVKTGILGYGRKFNYQGSTSINNNDSINPHGTAFSVSCWIKLDSLVSATGLSRFIWAVQNTSPSVVHYLAIDYENDKLEFRTDSDTPIIHYLGSTGALSVDTWYHIVAVNPGDGGDLKLYVNGSDVSASVATFSGNIREGDRYFRVANVGYNAGLNLPGMMDELGIWSIALTSDQVTELYNGGTGKTYPFL